MTDVDPGRWHEEFAGRAAEGFEYLDLLTGIDRGAECEIIARVVDVRTLQAQVVSTRIPAPGGSLGSIVALYPAADWHERETAEMFGVVFTGHPDPRPLLTDGAGPPPLLKSTPLPARVHTPWPGADAAARRRSRVPGVPDAWIEGDR